MNIQTHAYNLGAKIRFKKSDAPRTLEDLYRATEDEQLKEKLALLYSTITPKPAVKNNPLAWVAAATDPKCANKTFDKMVVTKGYAMGADGYRIHAYKLPESQAADLEGKFIDAGGNVLDLEVSNQNSWPAACFKMVFGDQYTASDTFDLSKCVIENSTYGSEKLFELELFGHKCRFNKKYIEQAFNGRKSVKVCAQTDFKGQTPVRFMLSETETAIVMPVRFAR